MERQKHTTHRIKDIKHTWTLHATLFLHTRQTATNCKGTVKCLQRRVSNNLDRLLWLWWSRNLLNQTKDSFHTKSVVQLIDANIILSEDKKNSLDTINSIKGKRYGRIKCRICTNITKKRDSSQKMSQFHHPLYLLKCCLLCWP